VSVFSLKIYLTKCSFKGKNAIYAKSEFEINIKYNIFAFKMFIYFFTNKQFKHTIT